MTPDRTTRPRLAADACSIGARERRDPLVGSAPPARGWLLFECPGPWPVKATRLFGDLGPEMDRRTLAAEVRPMLVRRPGRADTSAPRAWWFVDSVTRTWVRGQWSGTEDVRAALDLVDVHRAEASARMTPADPMILVCAHAKHDVCCAVRGRPIAAELAKRWPAEVWECSHLGGDRFAGNVAMLPDSVFYGGLDTVDAERLVADHLAGEADLEHLRGVGTQTSAGQAAVHELLRRQGSRRLGDVDVASIRPVAEGAWDITLLGNGGLPEQSVLRVERRWRTPAQLTCSGLQPKTAAEYVVR